MRVAFAGVAHSHAFSDAESAVDDGADSLAVWDPDDPQRLSSFTDRFDATVAGSLSELLAGRPDLVIVTARPATSASVVRAVLDAGIPCFLNKVAAATLPALDRLDEAVGDRHDRFFTASVLRFSPDFLDFRRSLAGEQVRTLGILVSHDISVFLTAERRWQDDPAVGGGTAVSMGLHGWELAAALFGPELSAGSGSVVRARGSSSEYAAVLRGTAGEVPVSIAVEGRTTTEVYEVQAGTEGGVRSVRLGDGDPHVSLGYRDCYAAAVAMAAGGPPPVAWPESRAVIRASILAADYARSEPEARR